jgi:DNA-directed RNA polymerase
MTVPRILWGCDDLLVSTTFFLISGQGQRWWTKADDPWQCLPICMELHAALESEDPHTYMSTLPVHQDSTCNGLQHYAALGGDGKGAAQVNLAVTDRPSDVYTYIANIVEKIVQRDTDNGCTLAASAWKIFLQGGQANGTCPLCLPDVVGC